MIEPDILNESAFLYYEIGKERGLIDMIQSIYTDDEIYQSFISIPPFKKEAPKLIWEKIQKLEIHLKRIMN